MDRQMLILTPHVGRRFTVALNKRWWRYAYPWSSLRAVQRIGAFRWSYLWLLTIPLAAKLLQTVPTKLNVPFYKEAIELHPRLPFSWTLLFFSGLFLVLGDIAFRFWCPPLVRDFEDFRAYRRTGRGEEHLRRILGDPEAHRVKDITDNVLDMSGPTGALFNKRRKQGRQPMGDDPPETVPPPNEEQLKEIFWGVRGRFDRSRFRRRTICAGLYLSALLALGIILVQNLIFVARELLD